MKKVFFMIACAGLMLVSCQNAPKTNVNPEPEQKAASVAVVEPLALAFQLAAYGYEVSSPLALIEAADIIASTPVQESDAVLDQREGGEEEKADNQRFAPAKLLQEARELADENEHLLALADLTARKLEAPTEETRGALGGPKQFVDRVNAHSWVQYYCDFAGGYFAEVAVIGDGDTDLDLYVYDQNYNLIASDTDYTDRCYVSFTPAWTGRFYIKIVNRGNVYNRFTLLTN